MAISISWPSFMIKWFRSPKIYSKINSTSCVTNHRDVTTFEVDGMVWNTENWISQEWNKIFPRNENILKLCFKDQAPKFRTLMVTIYHYCNLDLAVIITKTAQNVFKAAKNENNILWKIHILENKLTLHDILTQILNRSQEN